MLKINKGKVPKEFYEAKQTYSDNKIAIYLTGVGAFLMHQIISDQKLYTKVLNQAFDKWEAQRNPAVRSPNISQEAPSQKKAVVETETTKESITPAIEEKAVICRVNIKSDLKFLDASIPNQDEIATKISEAIRVIVSNLSAITVSMLYASISIERFSNINSNL